MKKREIVLDTETTGLDPLHGDRLVEIGCVEIENFIPTGREFHRYFNPERDVPEEATRVHGLSASFLSKHEIFAAEVDGFLEFIGDAPLVIHNASFDMGFVNAELARCGFSPVPLARAVDTLALARKKFPGAPASLDALCRRFGIDLSIRTQHGALIDARLLAEVYLELRGGRQPDLVVEQEEAAREAAAAAEALRPPPPRREPRPHQESEQERRAHEEWVSEKIKNALWRRVS